MTGEHRGRTGDRAATGGRDGDRELLAIGAFARLSGLSIGALRHYDELDLLRPAEVDRQTGYRRYRRSQLEDARLVARLRDLELPLEEIRELLGSDDPAARATILDRHGARVEARATRLHWILHQVRQLGRATPDTATEAIAMTTPPMPPEIDAATRRSLAVGLFNHVWKLLETPDRTPEQDDEMVHAAHASRYHWGEVGDAKNRAIGEWQIGRVYCVLGRGEPALHHARRCLELTEANGLESWMHASAYEGMSRASAVAGDLDAARAWHERAAEQVGRIEDPDDREIVEQDIATLPV